MSLGLAWVLNENQVDSIDWNNIKLTPFTLIKTVALLIGVTFWSEEGICF